MDRRLDDWMEVRMEDGRGFSNGIVTHHITEKEVELWIHSSGPFAHYQVRTQKGNCPSI